MSLNCLEQEFYTGCGIYSGPDIPALDVNHGDNLDDVLLKIANAQTPSTPTASQDVTTDSIKSTSKIRNPGSLCASAIVKRDFAYSLSTNSAGTTFTYDLVPVVSALPKGYELAVARIMITGQPIQGIGLIADSRSVASSLNIPLTRFPAVVDVLLRITSPCGQIDMTKRIDLINPSSTGQFIVNLEAMDLNPSSGEVVLTDQLNTIESRLLDAERKLQDVNQAKSTIAGQSSAIEDVQTKLSNPSILIVDYTKNGGNNSAELSTLVTDLYAEIKSLSDKVNSQSIELTNLKSKI